MDHKEKIDNIDLPRPSMWSDDMSRKLMTARHYAERAMYWVSVLPARPEWGTVAEDEIRKAIAGLRDCEEQLTKALMAYEAKPTGE